MTTRIHIVNFGPDVVEVHIPQLTPEKIFSQKSADFYVYDEHDVVIKEVKKEEKQ